MRIAKVGGSCKPWTQKNVEFEIYEILKFSLLETQIFRN